MEILQLPTAKLEERIEQEIAENPVLEKVESETPATETAEAPESVDIDQKELVVGEDSNGADDFERLMNLANEVPDHFDDGPQMSSNRIQELSDFKHDSLASIVTRTESLQEHLTAQLGELDLNDETLRLCLRIISHLAPEDGGYLRTSLADMLSANSGEEELVKAEKALRIVQSLEPQGIAARNLSECLLVQLQPGTPYEEEVRELVQHHLENLRDNKMPLITKATGFSMETIHAALEQIKKLNPKPAGEFIERVAQPVTPDCWIEQDDEGKYIVKTEEKFTRRLFISKYYRERLQSGQATKEEKEFILRKVNSAQWLMDSIEQRRNTLQQVAQEIVNRQVGFLEYGPEHLRPLKMKEIAEVVGVHLTTVSRAVDDKWIDTPRGILSLKSFFAGGRQSASGEDIAWEKVRIKLVELIKNEDKTKPYSDDELMKRLNAQGFDVKRRTIAKYRNKLNIPSSHKRRDWTADLS